MSRPASSAVSAGMLGTWQEIAQTANVELTGATMDLVAHLVVLPLVEAMLWIANMR